jgi:hypothetical protein
MAGYYIGTLKEFVEKVTKTQGDNAHAAAYSWRKSGSRLRLI